jgi:dethiobiotin synthetase
VVLVCGTGTEVGKTWVGARLLEELRDCGTRVAARKVAQSHDVDADGRPLGGLTDAEVLGGASGEPAATVCPPSRTYQLAMAPPMAAEALGLASFTVAALVDDLRWPVDPVGVGLVETAGGVASPQAADGDAVALARVLRPDLTLLVADAGLGTINGVRLSAAALWGGTPVVVVLDRFDPHHDLHRRNLEWLSVRDGYRVVTAPDGIGELASMVAP